MKFSTIFTPTTLFSLKESNSTNSGAKSLFLPSPYSIKMALLNQAITIGGDLEKLAAKKSLEFSYIRDAKIGFYITSGSSFCVNNSFIKILKPAREGGGFQQTVAFREYIYFSNSIEIIFEVENEDTKNYLKKYLHKINYFGKRGCFFQFFEYSDNPNEANVKIFNMQNVLSGILQEYDDFSPTATFDNVNNFSNTNTKRIREILTLPIKSLGSSKSFSYYKAI